MTVGRRVALGLGSLIMVVLLGGIAFLFAISWRSDDTPVAVDPHPGSQLKLVALGDSYTSGEGARRFFQHTNQRRPQRNECRRAPTAYPRLVADELGATLVFAACSGARVHHVLDQPQYPESRPEVYGGRRQLEVLREHSDADIVIVGVGGNDARFGDIGKACVMSPFSCLSKADSWMANLEALSDPHPRDHGRPLFERLVELYQAARDTAPHAAIFALNYPNPLIEDTVAGADAECTRDLISKPERRFLVREFIRRLNEIIEFAAVRAGVSLIDVSEAFEGKRICEALAGESAMNIIGIGPIDGVHLRLDRLLHNSFHPNERGHALLARMVLREVRAGAFTGQRNPEPVPIPEPIPWVPRPYGPPEGPYDFPSQTQCQGEQVDFVFPVTATKEARTVRIADALPNSTICHRLFEHDWRSVSADAYGEADIPIDLRFPGVASTNEILYQRNDGAWLKLIVSQQSLD